VAGFKSDTMCNTLLDYQYGSGSPATLYLALFSAAPTSAGGGVELSGGNYSRAAVTNNATNFPAASSKTKHNGTDIVFPIASADWATIVYAGWFDAGSGGDFRGAGPMSPNVTVTLGQQFRIPASTGFTATET